MRIAVKNAGGIPLARLWLITHLQHSSPKLSLSRQRRQPLVAPLPRNMHCKHHFRRRETRQDNTPSLRRRINHPMHPHCLLSSRRAMTVIVFLHNERVTSLTLPRFDPLQLEKASVCGSHHCTGYHVKYYYSVAASMPQLLAWTNLLHNTTYHLPTASAQSH